jgi:hypothetical protein
MKKKNYREKAAFSSMLAGFLSIIILASPTPIFTEMLHQASAKITPTSGQDSSEPEIALITESTTVG